MIAERMHTSPFFPPPVLRILLHWNIGRRFVVRAVLLPGRWSKAPIMKTASFNEKNSLEFIDRGRHANQHINPAITCFCHAA